MEAVSRQALRLKKSSSKSNAEWSELSLAITELADAVEALDSEDHSQAITDHLVPLATEFGELLRNIRSKLVSDVCEQLGRIVKTTRFAFTPLATALLEALASTAKASSVAIRNPGYQLFTVITEHSRYDIQVVHRVYRSSPQERVKSLVLEQMQIVLAVWPKDDIAPFYTDMVEIMRRGMLDPSSHVRSACRQTFCSFADMWPEKVGELVLIPSQPARDLLMKEKPHSAIAKAIRRKFNIETPKTDSLRLRRSAIRRQGSSTAGQSEDSIFVEVKESPRRPSQRTVAAEPSARAPSPGRAPTRSASPSGTNRTTSSTTRSASPSGAVRSASPSRTTAASPSRPTRETAAVVGPTPARSPTFTPVTAKHHAAASLRAQARDSEYDRYPNSATLEEKAAAVSHHTDNEAKEPKHVVPSRPQKRVSILEPPSISHFRDSDRYFEPPLDNRIRARREERESTTHDFSMVDFPHVSQSPSSDSSSPPKNRHAADALEFISQYRSSALDFGNNAQHFERHQPERRHDKPHGADSYTEFSLPPRPDWLRSPVATPREVPEEEKESVQDEAMIDSYLDRPISSSAPAPEPRASANVTLRGRRHLDDQDANGVAERARGLPVRSISTHVAAVPVPGDRPNVGIRHFANYSDSSLSNSDEEPPSMSIDTAFRATDMATAGVGYGVESSPVSDVDPSNDNCDDDESFDKENVDDNSVRQQGASENPVTQQADALANLDAIRAGVQKLRETHLRKFPGVSRMAMPGYADKRDQTALPARQPDHDVKADSRPEVSVEEQHSQRPTMTSQAQAIDDDDVQSARQSQQQKVTAPNAPQTATRLPLPSVQRQAYPPRRDHQSRQPPVQVGSNPPADFVRKPTAFTFGMAAPRTDQNPRTRAHPPKEVNADNSRAPPHQSDDAQNALNVGPPPRPSATPKPVTAPPPPQESRRPVPEHDTGIQTPHAGLLPNAPRQQKPFSLNEGLGLRSDKQGRSPATSNTESAQKPTPIAVPTASPAAEALPSRCPTVLNPKPENINARVASKMLFSFCLLLGTIFGVSGLIQAVTKVRDAYEYHNALLNRMNQFESSIVESYESVRKMDEKYVVWSEYVRELTEQDESNALHQLESIQVEVEKWQVEMKNDLIEFKRSLSGDIINAALAHLREPNTTSEAATATQSTP